MAAVNKYGLRRRLTKQADELPVLPAFAARLMALDPDGDDFFDELLALTETDPSFSARLLAKANSASSAANRPVMTLRDAIARTGSKNAADLLMALSVIQVFIPRDPWEKSLWRHSVQVAVLARYLAKRIHHPDVLPDELYLCGLIHDIGRFIMFQAAPDELRKVDASKGNTPEGLVDTEESTFGVTHMELGALACGRWGLPPLLASVLEAHHGPAILEPTTKLERVTCVVRMADVAMFPSTMPGTNGWADADEETIEAELMPHISPFANLDAQQLLMVIRAAGEEAEAVCRTLGVA